MTLGSPFTCNSHNEIKSELLVNAYICVLDYVGNPYER
jgi:hypothetical protein